MPYSNGLAIHSTKAADNIFGIRGHDFEYGVIIHDFSYDG
jgi:hypothetical protein